MIYNMNHTFSNQPMSKLDLFELLNVDNQLLFDENIDYFVIYSDSCYDSYASTAEEIYSFLHNYSINGTNQKYKSLSGWIDLLLLAFRANLLEKDDFALLKEAVTYFNFDTSHIYLGYVAKNNKNYNLP